MSDPDDIDLLAAEYVLGTLNAVERAAVAARIAGDAALARGIAAWEERLAPLIQTVPSVAPPQAVYDGIMARLFGPATGLSRSDAMTAAAWRRRVRAWQAATGGFALLAAAMSAWIAIRDVGPAPGDGRQFTAILQRDADAPAMLIDVDLTTRRLTVRPLAAAAPAGRAYELWIIDPALGEPRSLGVLPARAVAAESLAAFDPAVITAATYAVTVEPPNGSPTGRPSTPPVLLGKLSASRT